MPEPLESGDEVLIEDRHFTIEDQRGLGKRGNHPGEFSKPLCVISTIPTEETHIPIRLESENSQPVILLLVHPSVPMEGTCDESGVHEGDVGRDGHAVSISG